MQQPVRGQPDVLEPEAVRNMRWLHHGDGPFAQRAERGTKEPHFTHAGLLDQQVDQRSNRPTTARELFRERRIPCIHGAPTPASKLGRAPQRRMDVLWNWSRNWS